MSCTEVFPLNSLICGWKAMSNVSPFTRDVSPSFQRIQLNSVVPAWHVKRKWFLFSPINRFSLILRFLIAKVGLGFDAPKGSNWEICSTKSTSISSGISSKSILINGFKSFPWAISLTVLQRADLTCSKDDFSSLKASPAAIACPPNPSNSSAFAEIASYKFIPSILLAEHLNCFVSSEYVIKKVGL